MVESSGRLAAQLPKRRFGRLGWEMCPVSLGGAWLAGRSGEPRSFERAVKLVQDAVALGIEYIDTSINYGDSELYIGAALRAIPAEQHPRIATKSRVIKPDAPTAEGVYASCLASLERLGLARVDLFQLHEAECYGFERIVGPGGALEGLRRCRDEGLCLGIGVTGRPPALLARLVDTGEFDSVLTYLEYDLATAAATDELLPAAVRHDVAVIAASPARMGMFAGDGLLQRWEQQPEPVRSMRARLEALFARPVGQMADLSARYLWSDERVAQINVGSSRLDSLLSTVRAVLAGPLEPAALAQVRAWQGWRG